MPVFGVAISQVFEQFPIRVENIYEVAQIMKNDHFKAAACNLMRNKEWRDIHNL